MEGKKYGGRQKGTPNKTTSQAKEIIKNIVNDYLDDKFFEDLEKVDAATRLNIMVKLSAHIIPKERDVNMKIQDKNPIGGKLGEIKKMTADQLVAAYPELFKGLENTK